MVFRIADNIISPLGETTAENYEAIKAGNSALQQYVGKWGIPEPFTASLFSDEQTQGHAVEGLTRFESLAYNSAKRAIEEGASTFDATSGWPWMLIQSGISQRRRG